MKFKTVREGEQAVIYNLHGEGRLAIGPKRVFLFRERLQKLREYRADEFQYLIVTDVLGKVTHHRGPSLMFNNPLEYQSIRMAQGVQLDANHMIVVYRKVKNDVQRRTIQGPAVFIPTEDEWLHEFVWHGPDATKEFRFRPQQFRSTEVATIPEQFYYNINEVRTTDDTMITVKLMVFYQLKDVLTMISYTLAQPRLCDFPCVQILDMTHDPIADIINAVCSDVIAFAGKLTYEQFLEKTHELSKLSTYPQLMQRMERIGFDVQKVVYRGYHASDQLQLMQNQAIESRTQLRLNAEIEEMKQKLTDLKLTKEQARTEMKHQVDKSKQEHGQLLDKLKQHHSLEQKQLDHEQKLILAANKAKIHIDLKTAEDKQKEDYLNSLQDLGVDLTKYLTELNNPPRIERVEVL